MKVGDKVRIKSFRWYNTNKDERGNVPSRGVVFNILMSSYCGKEATIVSIGDYYIRLNIDRGHYCWTEDMFEEIQKELIIPEEYTIDKVENNKVILKKKEKKEKKELPKTWEECIKNLEYLEYIDDTADVRTFKSSFLDYDKCDRNLMPKGFGEPMLALMQLLVCREVYRQGWEPNWTDENSLKYCIETNKKYIHNITSYCFPKVLSFQSPEIRNEFRRNFEDLIEKAKELI